MQRIFHILNVTTLIALTVSLATFAGLHRGIPAAQISTQRTIVVTVDDLPGAEPGTDHAASDLKQLQRINRTIPAILKAHHVPAIGFVNEWKLQIPGERDARAALLADWLDAGLTLGNHTYSHPDFQITPLAQFEDDTIRGEVVTRALMISRGQTEKYFRHPFLDTGPTPEAKAAFEAFLKERGYEVAPVTFDCADWMFNDILGHALEKKDKKLAEKTKMEYLEYMDTVFTYFEGLTRNLFGRDIPQILLTHDSELNTETFDALLTRIEQRGYKFIPLEEALADLAYSTPDKYISSEGISWLNRWKLAFGQPTDAQYNPDPPKWVMQMSAAIRKEHKKQSAPAKYQSAPGFSCDGLRDRFFPFSLSLQN
ncbi:MAG TPA: polysaccharide deacetylase family protein [Candidatus Limnocylindria bacterium]|nr:polysaccharide deacetylase family protein [Candidatus Limnocylindria bacterium]